MWKHFLVALRGRIEYHKQHRTTSRITPSDQQTFHSLVTFYYCHAIPVIAWLNAIIIQNNQSPVFKRTAQTVDLCGEHIGNHMQTSQRFLYGI